jgi:hypothetical protein
MDASFPRAKLSITATSQEFPNPSGTFRWTETFPMEPFARNSDLWTIPPLKPRRDDTQPLFVLHRKKNQIPKGRGKDARPDAPDRYEFSSGLSYHELVDLNGTAPTDQFVFRITKLVEHTLVAKRIGRMKHN